jgi:hypothetical protein
LKQQVNNPPEPVVRRQKVLLSKGGVIIFLLIICLILAVTGRQVIRTWPQTHSQSSTGASSSQAAAPIQLPGGAALAPLTLSGSHTVIYEEQDHIYSAALSDKVPHVLNTPDYIYNRAVPALVTPSNELIYSGKGVWAMSLSGGPARQIASFAADQVITSLVVSQDGSSLAWSSAPANGSGTTHLYAGSLEHTAQVYQQSASQCPCYRAFSFMNQSTTTLLLTNDRGDHRSARYGLWTLDLNQGTTAKPQEILNDANQQGPLALAAQGNELLYSTFQGYVPWQTVAAPSDIMSLAYANSLSLASIDGTQQQLGKSQVLLPDQGDLTNEQSYHWVDTPEFSPDGQTLAYIEFSVSNQPDFPRQFAIYTYDLHDQTKTSTPHLLVTGSARYMELGGWLDNSVVTFYADNTLYALDVQNQTATTLVATGAYAHIVSIIS